MCNAYAVAFMEMRGLDNSLGAKIMLYSMVLAPKPYTLLAFSNDQLL